LASARHDRVTLFRAVGPAELELIRATGGSAFPKRVHHEPILTLTPSEEVARREARSWNVEDQRVGYVVRFEVDAGWLARYPVQDPDGAPQHWIPNEEIAALNDRILTPIQVVAALRPPPATRTRS
jgi:hypothetical protein